MDEVFVYWDNSNIFHEAQRLADEEVPDARYRVRIHFDNLLLYRMSGLKLGRPGDRNRRSSIASSKFLFAGIRIAYWTPRASSAS